MIDQPKTHTVDEFQQNIDQHLARLKRTGEAELLTVGGRGEIVVQDAASYQRLLDELEIAQSAAAIRRSLEQAKRGEGRPLREAIAELMAKADQADNSRDS